MSDCGEDAGTSAFAAQERVDALVGDLLLLRERADVRADQRVDAVAQPTSGLAEWNAGYPATANGFPVAAWLVAIAMVAYLRDPAFGATGGRLPRRARSGTRFSAPRLSLHAVAHIYDEPYAVPMPAEAAVLEVIAEPTRRRILDAVRGGERSVGELVEKVGMHQPGVSRHLKVLRDAGLVEVRRDAQRRLYRLRPEPLMELDAWLEPYRADWTARLDSLERHLRRTATPIPPSSKEHQ